MKGLLLNGFYSAIGNMKLFLPVVTVLGILLIITGNPTAQELFVYITITALSVNAVVSARKDAVSKWNKYELTMPVRRQDIIKSKYLTYLFWVMSGTVTAFIITLLTMVIHGNANLTYGLSNLSSMFVLGVGISLFTGALFYPLSCLTGIEKSETLLIISILLAIGLSVLTLYILNLFIGLFAARMLLFIAFYLAVFTASYGLTLALYLKKEF